LYQVPGGRGCAVAVLERDPHGDHPVELASHPGVPEPLLGAAGVQPGGAGVEFGVRVHGPRVTAVPMRTRCNHIEPDLAAIRPKAITEGGVPDRGAHPTSACLHVSMWPTRSPP
jgi:hypothetical protein